MSAKLPNESNSHNDQARTAEETEKYIDPDWEHFKPLPLPPFIDSFDHLAKWVDETVKKPKGLPPPPMVLVRWDTGYGEYAADDHKAITVRWTWAPSSIPMGARVHAIKLLLWHLGLHEPAGLQALLKESIGKKELAALRDWINEELAPRRTKRKPWAVNTLATLSKLIEEKTDPYMIASAIFEAVADADVVSFPRGSPKDSQEVKSARILKRFRDVGQAIENALNDGRGLRDEQNADDLAAKVLRAALRALGCSEREARTITRFKWKVE